MRVTSKGQVTIPKAIRDEYGLLPGTEVEFVENGGEIRVREGRGIEEPRARNASNICRGLEREGIST